jgi:MFS superfamily sulfate permease-like transporter
VTREQSPAGSLEKPQNGVAGLKYWRYDLVAGLMVSLTSLPFSLGIAIASGAPPIAGLTSAIIAGLIFPFLGGAYVTISGPAAGLAPALFAGMLALGHGNLAAGYPLLLAVICMVGAVQIVLSLLGAARLSAAFPVSVVEGMLASIGMIIMAKELPHFLGHEFKAHDFLGILAEVPAGVRMLQPKVFGLGLFCLALMFVLSKPAVRRRLVVPPPLLVVVIGAALGAVLGIGSSYRISIPSNILAHGITLPDFAGLFRDPSLKWAIVTTLLTLVMIDGVESLATIKAIDKVDPFKRRSSPDRTLLAMGVSNILSSVAGGLTIIPGGVKSKLCIVSGGRTLWANFHNAVFLLCFLFFGKSLINLIPYSALAAILLYTGFRMCEPAVWRHVAHVGPEQLVLFVTTIAVTLWTDLLMGIFAGIAVKLVLDILLTSRHVWTRFGRPMSYPEVFNYSVRHLALLFRDPVVRRERVNGSYHLYFDGPIVCSNSVHLNRELDRVPDDVSEVLFHIGPNVAMIDYTSCDRLMEFVEEFGRNGTCQAEIVGLDRMHKIWHAHNGTRLAPISELTGAPVPASAAAFEDSLADVQIPGVSSP